MSDDLAEQRIGLSSFVPKAWGDVEKVWITCYRVMLADEANLMGSPLHVAMADASVVFLFGRVRYLPPGVIETLAHRPARFGVRVTGSEVESSNGIYCLILSPLDRNGQVLGEPLVKATISSITGLLGAVYGRNIVYEKVYENTLNLRTSHSEAFSPSFVNPDTIPTPHLTAQTAEDIARAYAAIESLDPGAANRLRLSLRWFEQAMYDSGIDAVLRYWIAIETLAMPDSTNIRPVVETLADVNRVTYEEARERFLVGMLYGLRSSFVHSGLLPPIHHGVLDYMSAIYFDLLSSRLDLPKESRTTEALQRSKIDLAQYLRSRIS